MENTKERILLCALELFSKDGFEAVSVSDIAKQAGLTKGALYRHYENKRDIFNSILLRMEQNDAENAAVFDLPEQELEKDGENTEVLRYQGLPNTQRRSFAIGQRMTLRAASGGC